MLGEAGANIPTHAKNGDIDEFGTAVGHMASAVCQITEAGAQVSLIGFVDHLTIDGSFRT